MASLCSTLLSDTSSCNDIARLCSTFISDTPSCINMDKCCSTFISGTWKHNNTKDIDSSLGSRVVVPSSDISVAILPVMCDSDIDTDVKIQWAPSNIDDENNTTRRGTHMTSRLSNISHEVVYTQSAASGSDNHTCISQHSYSTINHYTYTQCCTNNRIQGSSAVSDSCSCAHLRYSTLNWILMQICL